MLLYQQQQNNATMKKYYLLIIIFLSLLGWNNNTIAQPYCNQAQGTAGFPSNVPCQTAVCGYDSWCCNTSWDGVCASEAALDAACGSCLAPPTNDLCANAITIGCGSVTFGYTLNGTNADAPAFCSTFLNTAPGVWYHFTGTGDQIEVSTCSAGTDYDTKIGVFSGSCGALTCVAGNDDDGSCTIGAGAVSSNVIFCSQFGVEYYIYVTGYSTYSGRFELSLNCTPFAAIVTCPADVLQNNDAGLCGAFITVPVPVAGVDYQNAVSFTNNITSDDTASGYYPVGTTSLIWTAASFCANPTCTQTITIQDTEPPVINNCPSDILVTSAPGTCGAVITFEPPRPDSLIADQSQLLTNTSMASFTQMDLAQSFIPAQNVICGAGLYSLSGGAGPADITISLYDNLPNAGGNLLASGTDYGVATGGNASVAWPSTPVVIGNTYYLVFTSSDGSWMIDGSTSDPYPFGNLFANTGYVPFPTYDFPFETFSCAAADMCGSYTFIQTDGTGLTSGSTFPVGITTMEYTATDPFGNSSVCTFSITVADTLAPVINCHADTTLYNDAGICGSLFSFVTPVGVDNCPDIFLPHSNTQNIPLSSGIGCADSYTYPNRLATVFDMPALGYAGPLHITAVELSIDQATSLSGTQMVDVNLYSLSGPMAIANLTLLAREQVIVPDTASAIFHIPLDTIIPDGTVLVYEVYIPDGHTDQNYIRIGTNFDGQSTPSYIMSTDCGVPDFTDLAALGAANAYVMNLIIGTSTQTISGLDSGAVFPVGTTIQSYLSIDAYGNTSTCAFDVTVIDNEAPAICFATIDTIVTYAQPSLTQPPFTVLSGGALTGRPFATGLCCSSNNPMTDMLQFTVDVTGTYGIHQIQTGAWDGYILLYTDSLDFTANPPVTFVGGDDDGTTGIGSSDIDAVTLNAGQQYYLISTAFSTAGNGAFTTSFTGPGNILQGVFPCQTNATLPNDTGMCSAVFNYTVPVGTDNCPGAVTTLTDGLGSGASFPIGVTTEEYTVTDAEGFTSTYSFTVTVEDTELPTITCPPDTTLVSDPGFCTVSGIALGTPVAGDNCGSAFVTNNATGSYAIGTTTVLWTVTDSAGNTATCHQRITVLDTIAPVFNYPADTILFADSGMCSTVLTYTLPVATDLCGGYLTLSQSVNQDSITPLNSVFCNAGGYHTENSYLRVYDLPAMGLPGDLNVSAIEFGIQDALAPSGKQSVTVKLYTLHGPLSYANMTLVASQSDSISNQSLTFYSIPISATISRDSILVVELYTPDGSVDSNLFSIGSNTQGQTGLSYLASIPCTLTEPADLAIVGFPNMHILLNIQAEMTTQLVSGIGSGGTFPVGTTTEVYSATDASGNTGFWSYDVVVIDNQVPSITCMPDTIIMPDSTGCFFTGALLIPPVGDNCGIATLVDDVPAYFPIGSALVTWIVTDINGNPNTCSQLVTIPEIVAPEITCRPDTTISTDPGLCTASGLNITIPVATDNCGVASVINDASTLPLGITLVNWTVTDDAGNTATCTQNVTVTDQEDPTIVCPMDVAVPNDSGVNSASGVNLGTPTIDDNCGVLTVVNNAVEPYAAGNTTVTWTVTDSAGNTATCTQTVTVNSTFGIESMDQDGDALRNDPNPFHSTSRISFYLHSSANVSLKVLDILGQTVAVFFEGKSLDAGAYNEELDARANHMVPGVYYLQLTIDNKTMVSKMMVN